ncbi:MAG: TolC family protein [Sphingobacteriaceae bacterium]
MIKKVNIFLFIAGILGSIGAFGQDTLMLSKKDLLQRLSDRNLQLKIANQEYKSAQADYRQSNAVFLPSIAVSHTAMATTNPLMAFGSKLNQEILSAADFNPALLNDPTTTRNYATKVEVLQPLVNLDGWYGRQAAKARMEAYAFQSSRAKEYVELESLKAFMQLQLAYKAVQVLEKANATATANLKLIENYYKQGLVQKTDLLLMQVRVNEVKNQFQYAQSTVQNASDYLALLLNEEMPNKVFKPSEELVNEKMLSPLPSLVPDNRRDILAMDKSAEAYRKLWQSSRLNLLPRLNAFSSYELYDKQVLETQAKGYLVGLQLSWTIFDGYKSVGKVQKARADFHKMDYENQQYKAQSQLELNKTTRQLKDAENKLTLSAMALSQSQEAYRIRSNRFKQGLEKTSDLLISEAQVFQKELEYQQAVFEYTFTQQYAQFLSK